ncbi:MAG: helix-turn-helix transcriptional regulator [Bacteroidota bacterium]
MLRFSQCDLGLSARERQVLEWVAHGQTTHQIAGRLDIGFETVQTYRRQLRRKLNAENGPHMVALAFRLGILR